MMKTVVTASSTLPPTMPIETGSFDKFMDHKGAFAQLANGGELFSDRRVFVTFRCLPNNLFLSCDHHAWAQVRFLPTSVCNYFYFSAHFLALKSRKSVRYEIWNGYI